MPQGRHVPTVASARLARELRSRRERAGFNQEAVAEEMGWAESKLYRIENDKSRVLQWDVKRLLGMYGVEGEEAEALIELAQLRNVTLQVLPFAVGEHGAMHGGMFYFLNFPSSDDPEKVYMEQQISGLYTQKPEDVDRYRLVFDHLRAQALGPEQTIAMLRAVAAELT